jgi:hypothetical protein
MKKKIIIINVLMSMAVLFAILFQSIHSYEHYSEQLSAKYSQHHLSKNKTETNNNHSVSEKCATCDFYFSSFTANNYYLFYFHKNNVVKDFTSFFSQHHSSFFKGCLFSLRAPPLSQNN